MPETMHNANYGNDMTKTSLMKQICICEFALLDLNLYLDTHPMDHGALTMFHDLDAKCKMLRAQHAAAYGPLDIYEVQDQTAWTWVRDPWPWEAGSEVY